MLKIFLVEDEFVVREGIKNNIDWKAHGYEFCGEASDGELAFPMIQKLMPDIVITDIRMPFMDGLTLSKLIKKEFPWMEIIILTGFEEFEYAKEGIKIGVAQYLSKPISGDDLLKEVDALASQIEKKRQEREIREQYVLDMEESLENEKKDLFQHLVMGTRNVAELLEMAKRMDVDLSALWYNIFLIKARSDKHEQDEYSNSLVEINDKLKQVVDENNLLSFERDLEGKAIIVKADSQEELEQQQIALTEQIHNIFGKYENVRYFGGIGIPVNRLTEFPTSYEKANQAFAQQYLVKESCIWDSSSMEQNRLLADDFNISHVDPKQIDKGKVRDFLKLGDKNEVAYFVDAFFDDLGSNALNSLLFTQYIIMDIYFCVADFVEGLQMQREEIEAIDPSSGVFQSADNAKQYIIRIINQALEMRETAASNRYGDVVDEVMRYIEEHYFEEELSLNVLASNVNFSPNHLSAVFSQQTGQTFIKYLTDYRMNKAKELLRCTGKRSSVISMEVGYKDPHYFSYLFKKTQGMTPTQYRGGKGMEGEE